MVGYKGSLVALTVLVTTVVALDNLQDASLQPNTRRTEELKLRPWRIPSPYIVEVNRQPLELSIDQQSDEQILKAAGVDNWISHVSDMSTKGDERISVTDKRSVREADRMASRSLFDRSEASTRVESKQQRGIVTKRRLKKRQAAVLESTSTVSVKAVATRETSLFTTHESIASVEQATDVISTGLLTVPGADDDKSSNTRSQIQIMATETVYVTPPVTTSQTREPSLATKSALSTRQSDDNLSVPSQAQQSLSFQDAEGDKDTQATSTGGRNASSSGSTVLAVLGTMAASILVNFVWAK
ncbi:hypothetical protein OIO90_004600 [Microbotryomycetes sp. JL221]|nr:hypothetical protein OIO90_004600 [Microbotryomycetes sp. JL221]